MKFLRSFCLLLFGIVFLWVIPCTFGEPSQATPPEAQTSPFPGGVSQGVPNYYPPPGAETPPASNPDPSQVQVAPSSEQASPQNSPPSTDPNVAATPNVLSETGQSAAFASEVETKTAGSAPPREQEPQGITRQSVMAKFAEKLTLKKGKKASIVIMTPIDYANAKLNDSIASAMQVALANYGVLKTQLRKDSLSSLTLEDFRTKAIRYDADILMQNIVRPTNLDLFLYDRRTPYFIYAYSQELPNPELYPLNKNMAVHYTKLLLRRTLYRYALDQFYELPRQPGSPVLPEELPRRIASVESVLQANREFSNHYYMAASLGAALSRGDGGKFWNSSLLSLQLGFRPYGRIQLEAAFDAFAYWAVIGSIKYLLPSKSSPFQVNLGIGGAWVGARKTISWDQTNGLGYNSYYVVPSASVIFPIGDVSLKGESRIFIGLQESKYIFTIMPGIQVSF